MIFSIPNASKKYLRHSTLFIRLLATWRCKYRRAKTLIVVVDHYIIHKNRKVERWLAENADLFAVAESDRSAVAIVTRDNNAKPSVPLPVAVTETGNVIL